MSKFIKGQDRSQGTLFPERLDDFVEEENAVRVIDVFIDDLDVSALGFRTERVLPPEGFGQCPEVVQVSRSH